VVAHFEFFLGELLTFAAPWVAMGVFAFPLSVSGEATSTKKKNKPVAPRIRLLLRIGENVAQ